MASSGFPSTVPRPPAAAKRKPEGPPEEPQKTEHVCTCQRVLRKTGNSRKVEHSVPTRAGSHGQKGERDSGNCLPIPQPMRLQAPGNPALPPGTGSIGAGMKAWVDQKHPASLCPRQSVGRRKAQALNVPHIQGAHLGRLQLYPSPQTDAPAHVCLASLCRHQRASFPPC